MFHHPLYTAPNESVRSVTVTSEIDVESAVLIVEWASDRTPRFLVGYEVEYRARGGNENGTQFVDGSTTKVVLTGLSQDIDYEVLGCSFLHLYTLYFMPHIYNMYIYIYIYIYICRRVASNRYRSYIRYESHTLTEHVSCNYKKYGRRYEKQF